MSTKASLIAAALSAHLGVEIKSEQEAKQLADEHQVNIAPLPVTTIFRDVYHKRKSDDVRVIDQENRVVLTVDATKTSKEIKEELAKLGIRSHGLSYQGRQLADDESVAALRGKEIQKDLAATAGLDDGSQTRPADDQPLSAEKVSERAPSSVWGPGGDGPSPTYYIADADLAPEFDCDFTNDTDDGKRFERGGYEYHRPFGWDRCALRVLGRYSDDVWLGEDGIRAQSSPGEWAVSYHGTAVDNIGLIAGGGYDIDKCKNNAFGLGIYSTPSMEVASSLRYAKQFEYNGKQYKVVLQNRVNLTGGKTKVISADHTGVGAEYFVTQEEDHIRPYGVCIQRVYSGCTVQ